MQKEYAKYAGKPSHLPRQKVACRRMHGIWATLISDEPVDDDLTARRVKEGRELA